MVHRSISGSSIILAVALHAFAVSLFVGCKNDDSADGEKAAAPAKESEKANAEPGKSEKPETASHPFIGTWEKDPGPGMKYTFNNDNTGTWTLFEPAAFTWKIKTQSEKHYVLEITDTEDGATYPLELDVIDQEHLNANLTEGIGEFKLRRK